MITMRREEMGWRLFSGFGALLFAGGLIGGRLIDGVEIASLVMTLVGVGGLLTGLLLRQQRGERIVDERFLLHRLKSSRFSLAVTAGALVGLQVYSAVVTNEIRWDLVVIIEVMAVSKLAAMIYQNATG
jgi:hypothetical protein